MLQPALLSPPPATDAETHLMLTADSGTVVQPAKLDEVVPTIKVHVCPFLPCVISQEMEASELPVITPPGLFAINGIVLGIAWSSVTWTNPDKGLLPGGGKIGVGWRLLGVAV